MLLVDDDPLQLSALQRWARDIGFETFLAKSGEEAIALLNRIRPAIVISDFNLPGINGLEVLKHAKTFFPAARVILHTGAAKDPLVENPVPGVQLLPKPSSFAVFFKIFQSVVHRAEAA